MNTFRCMGFFLWVVSLARAADPSTVIAVPSPTGDSSTGLPFGDIAAGVSLRYQQVYAGSAFSGMNQGGLITALAFNIKSGNRIGTTLPDIQIDFSTTSMAVDGLSTAFAANVGADDAMVFARGPMFVSDNTPGAPPGFGVLIKLTTPFLYRPAAGNLLMDVRYYQLQSSGFSSDYDAAYDQGDTVSCVYSFGVGNATGLANTIGLTTAFVVTPVPEPGSGLLLFAGVTVLGLFIRGSRCPRRDQN